MDSLKSVGATGKTHIKSMLQNLTPELQKLSSKSDFDFFKMIRSYSCKTYELNQFNNLFNL
jgi:hypothetical protein